MENFTERGGLSTSFGYSSLCPHIQHVEDDIFMEREVPKAVKMEVIALISYLFILTRILYLKTFSGIHQNKME